jgi:hypothetical protein
MGQVPPAARGLGGPEGLLYWCAFSGRAVATKCRPPTAARAPWFVLLTADHRGGKRGRGGRGDHGRGCAAAVIVAHNGGRTARHALFSTPPSKQAAIVTAHRQKGERRQRGKGKPLHGSNLRKVGVNTMRTAVGQTTLHHTPRCANATHRFFATRFSRARHVSAKNATFSSKSLVCRRTTARGPAATRLPTGS